jgi:hypothetical protein
MLPAPLTADKFISPVAFIVPFIVGLVLIATEGIGPVPLVTVIPVPPCTSVRSPTGRFVVTLTRVSVMFAVKIEVTPAPTATVANEIELSGVAGAEGVAAGVPATTFIAT